MGTSMIAAHKACTQSAKTYVEEALRWLPGDSQAESRAVPTASPGGGLQPAKQVSARILLADDNADMRDYVKRILSSQWAVGAVSDGRAALEAARERVPDLVLTDVMMPGLDGFELLRELRADPRTRAVPIILLSARAGEESRVEGLSAGADDYLIKPFSARELLACISARLEVARLRRENEKRVIDILETLTDGFQALDANGCFTYVNPAIKRLWEEQGINSDVLGKRLFDEVFPEARDTEIGQAFVRALTERTAIEIESFYPPFRRWFRVRYFAADANKIFADKHRLQQVINNLLTNAIKFTPEGGTIQVRLECEGSTAKLVVQDSGIGIAPELLPHVFERFKQADASTTRKYGGLGLGLTIVKHLVELHGGTVEVHSDGKGLGTTFTVRLPLMPRPLWRAGAGATNGANPENNAKPLHNVRILLVDDDQDQIDLVHFVLTTQGATLSSVGSAKEALQTLAELSPDLLISDLGMAEMDGYQFIQQVRSKIGAEKLPAIALSGYVSRRPRAGS
jgi:CheY-like chemotaxis protein